jgi:DNA-directed RNA polymerase subunit E'/Rpb7
MKINTVLETRINIDDINHLFCPNYNEKLLDILKERFNNCCFKSVFILNILKIIKRGDIHCKNKVLDGGCYIDINFEVEAIVYENGEIIHDCAIIQINPNGTMIAKSEYASLHIKNIDDLMVFKKEETIPVIVNLVRYNIYDTEISISAVPFMPILKPTIMYKIKDSFEDNCSEDVIKDIFDFSTLEDTKKTIKDILIKNPSVFKFFRELLYPYKKVNEEKYRKKIEISDIKSLCSIQQNDILYRPNSYIDSSWVSSLNKGEIEYIQGIDDTSVTLDISCKDYITHLLFEYNKNINSFLNFLTIYDSQEKIKSKAHVWQLYTLLKH